MTNLDQNNGSILPFNQNINWVQLVAALATLLTMFGITLDPHTQAAIVSLIVAGTVVVTWILHTFINHPANQAKAVAAIDKAVAVAKRTSNLFVLCLVGLFLASALSGCAANSTGGLSLDPNITTSLNNIGTFTLTDLSNANNIALANNDQIGSQCFITLSTFVKEAQVSVNGAGSQTVSGAFSALEATYAASQSGSTLLSQANLNAFYVGCGPLLARVNNTPAAFLAQVAALGAGSGATP